MVRGEWIDRPAGNAIFGPYFNKNCMSAGTQRKAFPNKNYPITIGYDPGSVNNACIFMQALL